MRGDAQKNGPDAAGGGIPGGETVVNRIIAARRDTGKQLPHSFEWWSPELQRALDILAAPIYHGLKIQIMGQAGCGYHVPTSDPAELERFAREVGHDASYSIVTGNGRVTWPILITLSPGDGHSQKRTTQGRSARQIPVAERST